MDYSDRFSRIEQKLDRVAEELAAIRADGIARRDVGNRWADNLVKFCIFIGGGVVQFFIHRFGS